MKKHKTWLIQTCQMGHLVMNSTMKVLQKQKEKGNRIKRMS